MFVNAFTKKIEQRFAFLSNICYYKIRNIAGGRFMAQDKITAKQQEILEYIKETILKKGYPPAVREICEAVHLKSTSSVHSHLSALEEKGYIRRDPTKPRTIEILDDTFNFNRREMVNIPLLGTIAAGEPLLAEEHIEDYFPFPAEALPNAETFMLTVKGESMINAGILPGDRLIVEQRSTARNGEIVAALIDDSATVKRFYKEDGYYRLQPENDAMDPIITDHVEILGKVIGLVRLMN
jgi:repressor LexA